MCKLLAIVIRSASSRAAWTMLMITAAAGCGSGEPAAVPKGYTPPAAADPAAGRPAGPAPWVKFSSPRGDFEVEFPVAPQAESGSQTGNKGYTAQAGENRYLISDPEVPPNPALTAELMAAAMRQTFAANLHWSIVETKPATLSGHQGEQSFFTIPVDGEGFVAGRSLMRVFAISSRVYILIVNGPQVSPTYADALRFLDSFKLTGAAAALAAPSHEWVEVKTNAFRVMMPGTPTQERLMIPSPTGGAPNFADSYKVIGGTAAYMCNYRDLPEAIVASAAPEKRFQINRDALMKQPGVTLVSQQSILAGPYRGEQYELRLPQGGVIGRQYVAGSRDYGVQVVYGLERPKAEDIKKFFDSFQIVAPPAPVVVPKVVGTPQANVVPTTGVPTAPPKPPESLKLGDEVELDEAGKSRQAKVTQVLGKDLVRLESEGRKLIGNRTKLRLTKASPAVDAAAAAKNQPSVQVLKTVDGRRQIKPTGKPATAEMALTVGMFVQMKIGNDWFVGEIKEVQGNGNFRVLQVDAKTDQTTTLSMLRIPTRELTRLKREQQAIEAATQLTTNRTWNDRAGKHKIEAQLVDVDDVGVRLAKPEGKIVPIPFAKLSQADLKLLQAAGLYVPPTKPARRTEKT